MTKRDIISALLAKDVPERMGLNEFFWPYIVENAWGAQGIAPGTDFNTRFNLDLCNLTWFSVPGPRPELQMIVEETDAWRVSRNAWGASYKYWKQQAGTPEHVNFLINSPQIWNNEFREAIIALDVTRPHDLPQLRLDYARVMANEEFVTFSSLFVFEELRTVLGDVAMLEALLLEPEWIHDFNTIITQKYIAWYEWLFREVGLPDGIHIFEDLGYTRAPFASPACHREMILPYHKQLFRFFKDYNLPIIVHSCGDFRPHLESLLEAGADCIQAMEAKTGMNVVEMAKTYKDRLCFMGNIDIQILESGNRERIREEVLGKINGMKALRAPYIFMSDHSIPPSVKLTDYEFMLELFWENCKY